MCNLIYFIINMEKEFENNCFNSMENNISVNSIFKQLTKTDEFKNMISNISNTINNLNDTAIENKSEDCVSNKSNIIEHYFTSKKGNNLCDCLENINTTLENILILLQKTK